MSRIVRLLFDCSDSLQSLRPQIQAAIKAQPNEWVSPFVAEYQQQTGDFVPEREYYQPEKFQVVICVFGGDLGAPVIRPTTTGSGDTASLEWRTAYTLRTASEPLEKPTLLVYHLRPPTAADASEETVLKFLAAQPEDIRSNVRTVPDWEALRQALARDLAPMLTPQPDLPDFGQLKLSTSEHFQNTLKKPKGHFDQKYVVNEVYVPRGNTEQQFGSFLSAFVPGKDQGRHVFAITGHAGKGKTNLLCRLAEMTNASQFASLSDKTLTTLLNSAEMNLTDRELDGYVQEAAGLSPAEGIRLLGLALQASEARMVIFIDAINELRGSQPYPAFNEQFAKMLNLIKAEHYPIQFCLSCRSESWPFFSSAPWVADNIWGQIDLSSPTVELGDFSTEERDTAIERYSRYYAVEGVLLDEAREDSRDPLALRLFNEAYTARTQKQARAETIEVRRVGEVRTLRRADVFQEFARNRREAIIQAVLPQVADIRDRTQREQVLQSYTTDYLINLAYAMFERRRDTLSKDEIMQVARTLKHPDADLGDAAFSSPNSVLVRFLDNDILGKRGDDNYGFVYEQYFEFSLGRFFALVRWPAMRREGALDTAAIEADMRQYVRLHGSLVEHHSFTNLFGALSFAVLAVEGDEMGHYAGHDTLFVRLIGAMTPGGFDWIQIACALIRDTRLANETLWRDLGEPDRPAAESRLRQLIGVLDNLTKASDFVVIWDVGETLKHLARANFAITLESVRRWAKEGDGLQPMFATQALIGLASQQHDPILDLLLDLFSDGRYRQDFWKARTLIFTTLELVRHLKLPNAEQVARLYDAVREYSTESEIPYVRGVALAALPFVSQNDPEKLNWIRQRADDETWRWARWNLVYELRLWPEEWPADDNAWVWQMIEHHVEKADNQLRYALAQTVQRLRRRNPAKADLVRQRLAGTPWVRPPRPMPTTDNIGVVYSAAFLEPGYENHIECRERVQAIVELIETVGGSNVTWIDPRPATEDELRLVHDVGNDFHRDKRPWTRYIDDVKKISEQMARGGQFERVGPFELRAESYDIALLSAGAVIQAVEYVLTRQAPRAAFAINRPPGHLANNTICVFNNVAIGARFAQTNYGLQRILIVDCDAHQGIHTARTFYNDPNVLYFSPHFWGEYAREFGTLEHTGVGEGTGWTFNVPFPQRMSDEGYEYIVDQLLVPLAMTFRPELIMISAGFDAHINDPLTRCRLTDRAFIHLAERLNTLARDLNIKVVGTLEGGYGLEGLARSQTHMLRIFGGWSMPPEQVGFTPVPDTGTTEHQHMALMADVRELVYRRARKMEGQLTHGKTGASFDFAGGHWGRILQAGATAIPDQFEMVVRRPEQAVTAYVCGDVREVIDSRASTLHPVPASARFGLGALGSGGADQIGEGIVLEGRASLTPPIPTSGGQVEMHTNVERVHTPFFVGWSGDPIVEAVIKSAAPITLRHLYEYVQQKLAQTDARAFGPGTVMLWQIAGLCALRDIHDRALKAPVHTGSRRITAPEHSDTYFSYRIMHRVLTSEGFNEDAVLPVVIAGMTYLPGSETLERLENAVFYAPPNAPSNGQTAQATPMRTHSHAVSWRRVDGFERTLRNLRLETSDAGYTQLTTETLPWLLGQLPAFMVHLDEWSRLSHAYVRGYLVTDPGAVQYSGG